MGKRAANIGQKVKNNYTKVRESTTVKMVGHFLRETWYLLIHNWNLTLPFLIVYSFVNIIVTSVLVKLALAVTLKLFGTTYISPDNLVRFIFAPTSIVCFLLLFIIVAFLHVIEIAGIMHAYSMSSIGKKTTLMGMLSAGIRSGIRGFLPQNWTILPYVLVLIPLTGFFSLSFSSLRAVIPGFIMEFITANQLYNFLYSILYVVMLLVEVTYIFAMNFFILEDSSFTAGCRKSRKLIKGNYFFTALCLVIISALFSLAVTTFSGLISSLFVQLLGLLRRGSSDVTAAGELASAILVMNRFIGAVIAPAVNIAALTHLFFRYLEDKEMLASISRNAFRDRPLKPWQTGIAVVVALAAVVTFGFQNNSYLFETEPLTRPEIVAHRGDSVNAPENTRPAFELALLENVEWVELDVHLTKDGVLIVSHDEDLTRVSGQKIMVNDKTYDELMQLDVGTWFSEDYAGLKFSTLDEILKLYKDKIKVQIEIKTDGYYEGIADKVLEIVNANGMHDQIIVTSLSPEPLLRMKELDPTIKTVYSMFVAWEHIEDIPFSDYYTIEEKNVTEELVKHVHEKGGLLFAWTVNSEDTVQHLVDCGVDGILTDNPLMMRRALDEASYTNGLPRLVRKYLFELRNY